MFIKRVALQGFKTFAKRTEFIFETGITAVVGPNGSGKSNIVDAIRWCLGEQSFSMLRSKKTSDVIFSGSDKRARLGMAEVTLTLDNSAGQIPLDFTEIEITRRAYRDGNSEYLLNGKRVRLLDITEALAHTGLSKRTYAVIGQGLIDRVLNLSPEERRTLFEEAAGITGYQHKRATTLNRLAATEQNLLRVHDILAELTPRLKYLQRQAERTREYERLAADLRTMLRDWYGFRWHQTLGALEDHGKLELELRQIVTQRQQALAQFEEGLKTLRDKQAALRSQVTDLQQQRSSEHQVAEQNSRDLAVATERLHQLQTRHEEAIAERKMLQQEQLVQQKRYQALQTSLVTAKALVVERQQTVTTAQATVAQRQQEQIRLQNALDAARTTLQRVQSERIECESRLRQFGERQQALAEEQNNQQHAQATATEAAATANQVVVKHEQALSDLEMQVETLQATINGLQDKITDNRRQLQTVESETQAAVRTLDRLQTRHDLLQRLHDEGAGYASGVRAILQASHVKHRNDGEPNAQQLTGIQGVVATLIHVPADLDKAIETALGGAMQNVVTATWQETQAAINFLKESRQGRATFLPLDRLRVPSFIPAPKAAGILGNAVELVDYDDVVAGAIEQLLNRVWIADALSAARRALDNYRNNLRPTVVTTGGEIIRPGGAVTGGNDARRRDDSILARERELRALPAEIQRAGDAHQRHQARVAILQQTIQEKETERKTTEATWTDLTHRERTLRQTLTEARLHLDRAEQTVQWHTEQQSKNLQTIEQLVAETERLSLQRRQLDDKEKHVQQELTAAEEAVARAGVSELLQEVADLRAAAAVAETELRNQQELCENQARQLERLDEQQQSKGRTIERFAADDQTLRNQIAEITTTEEQLQRTLDGLHQQIEPLQADLERLGTTRHDSEERERQTQQALRKDESNWNNARLQLQRTEDALHQLQREIEQDLGFVIVEQSDSLAYQPPLALDAVVEQLPILETMPDGLENEVRETRARLSRLTNVNPDALREYDEAAGRHEFLLSQSADLESAIADMRKVVSELDDLMEEALKRTFAAVSTQFVHFFQRLFNGGTAQLILTTPDDLTNTGIEIIARPPGKRPQSLALLSGGERTLAACALIFAILRVSPTPFCVLDEVDAALDEANVDRFRLTVESLSDNTQFIIVTHNRRTLEGASAIYGVTMGNDGISRVISLRLEGDQILQRDQQDNIESDSDLKQIEELVQM